MKEKSNQSLMIINHSPSLKSIKNNKSLQNISTNNIYLDKQIDNNDSNNFHQDNQQYSGFILGDILNNDIEDLVKNNFYKDSIKEKNTELDLNKFSNINEKPSFQKSSSIF